MRSHVAQNPIDATLLLARPPKSQPSFRVFSFTNGTFHWTIVVLPPPILPATKDLFILLFLNFLFSSYDNASTFTFYTSNVVSNFVSLSFRREETHEAIIFPLWKTKLSFSFLYNIYVTIFFETILISHRFYFDPLS